MGAAHSPAIESRDTAAPATRSPLPIRLLDVGLVVVICVIVMLFSSYGRPIWLDEFLHFALGGLSSPGEVLDVIRESTATINHGQTGVYMFLDYLLLEVFGASALALRLPSLLSAVLLLVAALTFVRAQGIGYFGQYLALAALTAQSSLMYFTGEARPYMPLAAAAVGILAYYSVPVADRQRPRIRALGWISAIWGALMHPFFPVYWALLAVFAYAERARREQWELRSLRRFVEFANVRLVAVGAALALPLGAFTWMQGSELDFNNQWVYIATSGGFLHNFVAATHFQFLPLRGPILEWLVLLPVAYLVVYRFLPARIRTTLRATLAPVSLITVLLAISLALSGLSYYAGYWILPRQWVVGQAIIPLASIWLGAACYRLLAPHHERLARVGVVLCSLVIVALAGRVVTQQLVDLKNSAGTPPANPAAIPAAESEAWVARANANIERGGPVSPEFAEFYGKR